jgi:hypothetical protein
VNSVAANLTSSTRNSAITAFVLIAALAAAAWFVVVSPKRSDASKVKDQIAAAQTQLATATQAAAAANARAEAAALLALPSAPDQPGILDQFNAVGRSTGTVVATVTPATTPTAPTSVAFTVVVNGKYFQIRDFIHKLRTQVRLGRTGTVKASGRFFDVSSVSIAQGTVPGQLAATLTVTAGVLAPPASAVSATTGTTPTTTTASGVTGSSN